ncbi:MAG: acyltransferase [Deltaproteobacteria bacterium]|nr:acyltransferase [Deltaproteobacteria bacterium]
MSEPRPGDDAAPKPARDPGEARAAQDATSGLRRFFTPNLLANRFPELHGVRLLAILSVQQLHVTSIMRSHGLIRTKGAALFAIRSLSISFGMDLFFVLSGFLIGMMLMHATRTGEIAGARGVARFYARRAFRTFPLYYAVLLALAVLLPFTPIHRENFPYELAYLTNYATDDPDEPVVMPWGWSLCVEEHFYLAIPFLLAGLLLLRSHLARILALLGLFASCLVVRLAIFASHQGPWTDKEHFHVFWIHTHTRYDTLVAGILLAYLHFHFKERLDAWLARPLLRSALTGLAAACFALLMFPFEVAGPKHFLILRLLNWGTISSIFFLASLALLLHGDGLVKRALSHRAFLVVGTLGYAAYLVHIPAFERIVIPFLALATALKWSFFAVWSLGLCGMVGLSFGIGYLLHLLVEKPALVLRDRFFP